MLNWTPPYTVNQGLQITADWFPNQENYRTSGGMLPKVVGLD